MGDERKDQPPSDQKEPARDKPNPYPTKDVNSIVVLPKPSTEDK